MKRLKNLRGILKTVLVTQKPFIQTLTKSYSTKSQEVLDILHKRFGNKTKLQLLLLKNPSLHNVDRNNITEVADFLYKYENFKPDDLLKHPSLLVSTVLTLKYRQKILKECGFTEVNIESLASYLQIVNRRSIVNLKKGNLIPDSLDVQENLIKYLSPWPTFPPMQKWNPSEETTLIEIKLKVLCRFLELYLNYPHDKFHSAINKYPHIKHRPLEEINQVFHLIKNVFQLPNEKIIKNFAILHAKYNNIQMMLEKVKYLSGLELKEVIFKHPTLLNVNYSAMLKIQQLLNDFEIPIESQQKGLHIYTLKYETVLTRLTELSEAPDFKKFMKQPGILQLVIHKKRADSRLCKLKNNEKPITTMSVYIGQDVSYEKFTRNVNKISLRVTRPMYIFKMFKEKYSQKDIAIQLRKHQHYNEVPLTQMNVVIDYLIKRFDISDIYENFQIILYPLDKIVNIMNIILLDKSKTDVKLMNVELNLLSKKQYLSLVLYFVEKVHGFHFKSDCNDIYEKISKEETEELLNISN